MPRQTPATYRAEAARLRAEAAKLKARADAALAAAESLEALADATAALTGDDPEANVTSEQMPASPVSISIGRSNLPRRPRSLRDRVLAAFHARGLTLNGAAREMGMSPSMLSMVLRRERQMTPAIRKKIREVLGLDV